MLIWSIKTVGCPLQNAHFTSSKCKPHSSYIINHGSGLLNLRLIAVLLIQCLPLEHEGCF